MAYVEANDFAGNFGKESGIPDLKEKIEAFRKNPVAEGVDIRGTKRTCLKLFIRDMMFDKHLDMGDSVWVFSGETYPAYCLYWNE